MEIEAQITPANFSGNTAVPVALRGEAPHGVSRWSQTVTIADPQLWWSWDLGKQNLYKIAAKRSGDSAEKTEIFGIRSIRHDQDWVWYLNDQRIYLRGTNYIATQWLSQADKRWYDRDVAMLRGANLNTVRVHAHLERPEFYTAADEQGVLVWQDFPLQWGYTDTAAFRWKRFVRPATWWTNMPTIPRSWSGRCTMSLRTRWTGCRSMIRSRTLRSTSSSRRRSRASILRG